MSWFLLTIKSSLWTHLPAPRPPEAGRWPRSTGPGCWQTGRSSCPWCLLCGGTRSGGQNIPETLYLLFTTHLSPFSQSQNFYILWFHVSIWEWMSVSVLQKLQQLKDKIFFSTGMAKTDWSNYWHNCLHPYLINLVILSGKDDRKTDLQSVDKSANLMQAGITLLPSILHLSDNYKSSLTDKVIHKVMWVLLIFRRHWQSLIKTSYFSKWSFCNHNKV